MFVLLVCMEKQWTTNIIYIFCHETKLIPRSQCLTECRNSCKLCFLKRLQHKTNKHLIDWWLFLFCSSELTHADVFEWTRIVPNVLLVHFFGTFAKAVSSVVSCHAYYPLVNLMSTLSLFLFIEDVNMNCGLHKNKNNNHNMT